MKLVEIARGHLRVRKGPRSITVYGEVLLRGHGSPDFVLFRNSIEKLDPPNDTEYLSCAEQEQVLQFIKEEFSRKEMPLKIEK